MFIIITSILQIILHVNLHLHVHILIGFVEESELPTLYKNTLLSVCPLTCGAGIKGKICEAIAFRTPVLTNQIGNEGINLENEKLVVRGD